MEEERRYDNVQIVNVVDGTIIEGHDAVKMQFEREQKMLAEHGVSIIFQVYRLDLQADTLEELLGNKLAEIRVDGNFVSEVDTVAVVKDKVRSLLKEKAPDTLTVEEADLLTLYFNGRPLQDDKEFYADNYIMLPAWIQIYLHHCDSEKAVQLINKLREK
jgi:hypothetical protein